MLTTDSTLSPLQRTRSDDASMACVSAMPPPALREPIASLVRHARTGRAVAESSRQQRLRTLARRLLARGRVDIGARAMQQWLDDVLLRGISLDADTMEDLRQHALALWHLQRPQAACTFFQVTRAGPDQPGLG
jgi:hypothetical protein